MYLTQKEAAVIIRENFGENAEAIGTNGGTIFWIFRGESENNVRTFRAFKNTFVITEIH